MLERKDVFVGAGGGLLVGKILLAGFGWLGKMLLGGLVGGTFVLGAVLRGLGSLSFVCCVVWDGFTGRLPNILTFFSVETGNKPSFFSGAGASGLEGSLISNFFV